MRRFLEFSDTFAGRWVSVCLAISVVTIAFFTGCAIIAATVGDSWAETCVSEGGTFKQVLNNSGEYDEICEMPAGGR